MKQISPIFLKNFIVRRTEFEANFRICLVRGFVGSWVRGFVGAFVGSSQFFSGTAEQIFLKFCMNLDIKKSKASTEPDF